MKLSVFIVFKQDKRGPEIQGVFGAMADAKRACRKWSDTVLELPFDEELPRRRGRFGVWHHPQSGKVFKAGKWRAAK